MGQGYNTTYKCIAITQKIHLSFDRCIFHLFFNPSHKQIHYFFLLGRSKFNIFRYSVPLVKATAAAARRCVLCNKHRVSAHGGLAWPSFAINDGASLSRTKSRACERTVSIPLFFTYSLSFSFSLKLLLNFDFSNFKSACSSSA